MASGHRQVDHTADLALELWAPDECELLLEGARAVIAVLTEDAAVTHTSAREVKISAVDREDRLVQWLNEVLYLAVTEGFLFGDAEITLQDGGLRATLRGEADAGARIATELKSVTYHELRLEPGSESPSGEWRAHLVIDV